ncbi:MAG: hypothetical protein IIB65_11895, partial [Proteobacteria bacterium]|nr:hypothetical protein [Pseudomonadota bacterium]
MAGVFALLLLLPGFGFGGSRITHAEGLRHEGDEGKIFLPPPPSFSKTPYFVPCGSPPKLERNVDRDQDGLTDIDEQIKHFTNPRLADSDFDGLSDWHEVICYKTEPNNFDTAGYGFSDAADALYRLTNQFS